MNEIREKVLEGLECCIEKGWCKGDTGCPYWRESEWHFDDCKQMLKDIQSLLKPVKPRSKTRHPKGEYPQIQHFCGSCNAILFRKKQKFCIECGTPAKWD